MKNYHIITVTYKGPTYSKGSRFILRSERFKSSVTVSKNYSYNNVLDQAIDWLTTSGFVIIGQSEGKGCDYIITDTFKPLK